MQMLIMMALAVFLPTTSTASISKEPDLTTQSSVVTITKDTRTAHRFSSSTLTSSPIETTTTIPTAVLSRRALLFRDVSYRTLPSPILTTAASTEEGEAV